MSEALFFFPEYERCEESEEVTGEIRKLKEMVESYKALYEKRCRDMTEMEVALKSKEYDLRQLKGEIQSKDDTIDTLRKKVEQETTGNSYKATGISKGGLPRKFLFYYLYSFPPSGCGQAQY